LLASLACIQRTGSAASDAADDGSPEAAAAGESGSTSSDSPLPPGVSVLAEEGALAFALFGATDKVELRQIDVSGQPFARAIEAEIKEAGCKSVV
jgi:hypothetical protein